MGVYLSAAFSMIPEMKPDTGEATKNDSLVKGILTNALSGDYALQY
jgi:hypothetical protein